MVLALACTAYAGEIPYGIPAAGEIQNGVTAAGEMPNDVTLLNLLLILL